MFVSKYKFKTDADSVATALSELLPIIIIIPSTDCDAIRDAIYGVVVRHEVDQGALGDAYIELIRNARLDAQ